MASLHRHTGADATGSDLTDDEIFEVLSNRRRRFVIHALKREEDPIAVSDLSTYVTAWEQGVDPEQVEYEDRRNVHTTLRRTHLPKLEERDVVTVDEESDLVEPTPRLRELDIYIEVLRGQEIPWSLYYLGLGALSIATLLAVWAGVPGLAAFTPLHVGALTTVGFAVSALAHYYYGQHARLGGAKKPPEVR